jgi:hypothetical protein
LAVARGDLKQKRDNNADSQTSGLLASELPETPPQTEFYSISLPKRDDRRLGSIVAFVVTGQSANRCLKPGLDGDSIGIAYG